MLHVTNGSVMVSRIHDLHLGGGVLPWDDVLHDGPVPQGERAGGLRRVRAAFLAGGDATEAAEIERSFEKRDRTLREAVTSRQEIVLWFEHDLYDQLQLLQVMDLLAGEFRPTVAEAAAVGQELEGRQEPDITTRPDAAPPPPATTAVLARDYLGAQSDEVLRVWFEARRVLTDGEWAAAGDAWRRFRSDDPSGLAAFDDLRAWPELRSALRRHLQQFPSTANGLSRTEHQTLQALSVGPRRPRDLYTASNHAVEEAVFMGDWAWWTHIAPLLTAEHPLVRVEGTAPARWHDADWWGEEPETPRLAITDDGRRVLAGDADRVALNGIDRWLGGVHVQGRGPVWRWDATRQTVAFR
jgi:hypothetical protein